MPFSSSYERILEIVMIRIDNIIDTALHYPDTTGSGEINLPRH